MSNTHRIRDKLGEVLNHPQTSLENQLVNSWQDGRKVAENYSHPRSGLGAENRVSQDADCLAACLLQNVVKHVIPL
jgi:hypothetical protein